MRSRTITLTCLTLAALPLAALLPVGAAALISTGDGGWVWQNPLPQGSNLYAVDFADAAHGWAVGDAGTILATTDGGATWKTQRSGSDRELRGVSFADATHGCAVGQFGAIFTTTNGGVTWTTRSAGTDRGLRGVSFADAAHGWAVGDDGTILRTTDGGATWNAQSAGLPYLTLSDVSFPDTSHGWAVGNAGTIRATTDGGATWSAQSSGTANALWGVSFPDATHGWAVGDVGIILTTADGGATWSAQWTGSTAWLSGVSFVDVDHGWAVGASGTILVAGAGGWSAQTSPTTALLSAVSFTDATHGWAVGDGGTILTATAGGWSPQSSGSTRDLDDVHFTDATHGWAVGDRGTIVVTTDGGVTWAAQSSGTVNGLAGVWAADAARCWMVGNDRLGPTLWGPGSILATTTGGWPTPRITVSAPAAGASWPADTSRTVTWSVSSPVPLGEFKVWLVSAGGTWYIGKQVLPVAGQTSYSTQVTTSVPLGAGYKAYVYWRPTSEGGAWYATAKSGAFSIVAGPPVITITAPVATSSWPSGSTQTLAWRLSRAAPSGEFRVWLVSAAGGWYVDKQVLPITGATTYSTGVTVSCPAASGYKAYVYWRPTVGSGSWASTSRSAAFTVTPLNITNPTAASSWKVASSQAVTWTMDPAVSVGEFKVWLASAAGGWYIGRVVPAMATWTSYSCSLIVSCPAGTGYKACVHYRPTVGSGSWAITMQSAPFTVVP